MTSHEFFDYTYPDNLIVCVKCGVDCGDFLKYEICRVSVPLKEVLPLEVLKKIDCHYYSHITIIHSLCDKCVIPSNIEELLRARFFIKNVKAIK
jgi:hypothetical protein